MGKSSEMHIALRAEEMATMYEPTFTKKEAIQTGVELVNNLLESGEVDKMQFMANLCRLKEVVNSADTEMRKHLPQEKANVYGVEFTPVNGGNTINYSEDEIYQQLKADLDARAELLKLAQHQTIIDAYGNDVPKVSTTPRKSSITIKF
jgi:hypothetical protein